MSQAASFLRFLFVLAVVCGAVFLPDALPYTTVFAASSPSDTDFPATINIGWLINEFHADPANDLAGDANGDGLRDAQHDEFVELFNDSGVTADISGWTLADEFEIRHHFPEGTIVPDQCAIVVFGGGVPTGQFGNAVVQIASSGGLALDNTGDTIVLRNGPEAMQSVAYGFEGNEDQSLTRNPDVSGEFAGHLAAGDSRFSPGTRLDGILFTGCPGHDAAPTLIESQPADGAAGVEIDSSIIVTFSEPVAVGESWYEIACTKSGYHTAMTGGSEASYTLIPETAFAYEENCQVTLFAAAISDLDGQPQPMEADAQWQFTTEMEPDSAPHVVDSIPEDGAKGVARAATLVFTFSEPVSLLETAVELQCSHSGTVPLALSGGPSQFQMEPEIELEMGQLCTLTVAAGGVRDLDANDPPDQMMADWQISFSTEPADFLLINEVDSKTPGIDDAEFIELFDGGHGRTQLDGLAIVLFSGHDDQAYASFDLSGLQTDDSGYTLLGSSGVVGVDLVMDDTILQNGVDAVALYQASAAEMPVGTVVTTDNLLDAVVYGADPADSGLMILLHPGEAQVNENSRTLDDFHSLQRCPDGSGGQRRTGTYWPDVPTAKEANNCVKDTAPQISATTPADGALHTPQDSDLAIMFSEEVTVEGQWFDINCEHSGSHEAASSGGGVQHILRPTKPFAFGEQCMVTVLADQVHDVDAADPPDQLSADYSWSFTVIPARHMLINEVDADTPGVDKAEFIELYDNGQGSIPLDGLVLVLFNGADDLSYKAVDLDNQRTDEQGRFVLGNTAVSAVDLILPDGTIQNGADAVALYEGDGLDFPIGSTITTDNLLDAVVYGSANVPDTGLLALLVNGQQQIDENGRGHAAGDSNQRCPDGAGSQRDSTSFAPNLATPGRVNKCTYDAAPGLISTTPGAGDRDIAVDSPLTINFSEAVDLTEAWFTFVCEKAGNPEVGVRHMEDQVVLKPHNDLLYSDSCVVTVLGGRVRDSDLDDPPDNMGGDHSWSFTTVALPVAENVMINEVDADTLGVDTAEFVELYDGGLGNTALDGLTLVLFNGNDDLSYRAIDLDGYQTDGRGYYLLGNTAVSGVDRHFSDGTLQNGPDAVALYAGDASEFPNGSAVSTEGLLDALVYSTGSESAPGLLPLLQAGETIVDEDGNLAKDTHSNQRCPNGAGGQRKTGAYLQNSPTPKTANQCAIDSPPTITGHEPRDGASDVSKDAAISITFSEAVSLADNSVQLRCGSGGILDLTISGGPLNFSIKPFNPLPHGQICTVAVFKDNVSDLDDIDPPDKMAGDYSWSFVTVTTPVARHVLINEVDADTPGVDTAEFIELYDGGHGSTVLDGLDLVLFNGAGDCAYRHISLAGYQTSADGYFVIGGSAVPGVDLVIATGVIENGPDAVALYGHEDSNRCDPQERGLLDALVYHTNDKDDPGLSFLLLENEPQVNEGYWRDPILDSNQRCPNGQGGQRVTSGYVQNQPTPGAANNCTIDKPPEIAQVFPADGSLDVPQDSVLLVHFDEPVQVGEAWIKLSCEKQGAVDLAVFGGPQQYTVQPAMLEPFDNCMAAVAGVEVRDRDGYADALTGSYSWQFSTGGSQIAVSAGFTSNSPVTIGEPLRFFNTSRGPQPMTYEWDFGDGRPLASEFEPLHVYERVGVYSVTLTVKTSGGETAVYSAPVIIQPAQIYSPFLIGS